MPFAVWDQVIEKELSRLFHDRVSTFGEESAVAREIVVFGEMERQPGRAHGPDARAGAIDGNGISPEVGIVVQDESSGAVIEPRHAAAVFTRRVDQVE